VRFEFQGSLSSEELYSNLHPIADAASRSKVFAISALTGYRQEFSDRFIATLFQPHN